MAGLTLDAGALIAFERNVAGACRRAKLVYRHDASELRTWGNHGRDPSRNHATIAIVKPISCQQGWTAEGGIGI